MPQINYHFYVHTISTCIFVNKYIYLHGSGHEQGSSPLDAKYDRAAEHTTANGEKVWWTVLEHLYFGTDIHKYYMNQYLKIEICFS